METSPITNHVTLQKPAEVALRESEERYRSLVTATAMVVWTTDPGGEVIEDIPAWRAFTGQAPEEIAGWGWVEALHPDDRERTVGVWSRAVATRTLYETEYRMRRHDGVYRIVRTRGVPVLQEDGTIREWVGTCEDITELREAEERSDATRQVLELFAAATSRAEYLEALTRLLGAWSGSRCVGIRIVDEQRNIPYEAYSGFSPDFWEKESCLSLDRDECACTRVIRGVPEPQDLPVMTAAGSFHCPDAPRFITGLTPEQRARFRGTCVKQGFESITIIPIRYHDHVLGAIHLADETPHRIASKVVELIEALSPLVGEAVNHFTLEEELRHHADEQSALLSVSSAAMTLLDTDGLVAAALDAVLPVVDADAGWVILPGSTPGGRPRIPAYRGVPEEFIEAEMASPLDACPLCAPFLGGAGPRVEPCQLKQCPRVQAEVVAKTGLESHVGVPLAAGGKLLGILSLAWKGVYGPAPAERALLLAIGGQIGVALEKARLYEAERSARERLQALSRELVEVQESERRRIARQLHDEAGQELATLKVGLALLGRQAGGDTAIPTGVIELQRNVDDVLEQLHSLAADLRPASLDHLGLVPALRDLVNTLDRQDGPAMLFEAVGLGPERLPAAVETALYRIVQEALTNAVRHSGASRASVLLQCREGGLIALVEDNGTGFDCDAAMSRGRLGIVGMRERAEMLGGTLRVESSTSQGTTVLVEVPHALAAPDRR